MECLLKENNVLKDRIDQLEQNVLNQMPALVSNHIIQNYKIEGMHEMSKVELKNTLESTIDNKLEQLLLKINNNNNSNNIQPAIIPPTNSEITQGGYPAYHWGGKMYRYPSNIT